MSSCHKIKWSVRTSPTSSRFAWSNPPKMIKMHDDNAPAHTLLFVNYWSKSKPFCCLSHNIGFFRFPKFKITLKARRFAAYKRTKLYDWKSITISQRPSSRDNSGIEVLWIMWSVWGVTWLVVDELLEIFWEKPKFSFFMEKTPHMWLITGFADMTWRKKRWFTDRIIFFIFTFAYVFNEFL